MGPAIRLEARFASRWLIRDNWLCDRIVRDLRRHESMTSAEIDSLGLLLLHRTLVAAIAKLPYYRRIRDRFAISDSIDVLRRHFPIITKETLLENRDQLYPNRGSPRRWDAVGQTSGTTGTPLSVFRSPRSVLMENAFLRRHWEWGGYKYGMRRATLRGEVVAPLERQLPPYWFWNRYNNQLLISSRHLRPATADAIIDELERFSPHMLQAYPSTAYTLARLMADRKRRLHIPVAFIASEPLYPDQRELIADRFGATVMEMYGMAERVAYATECEHGSLHVNPDYSYVEIVDADGRPTRDEGNVVGTTYHNYTMPLVRYHLSDRARWKPGWCACKRPFPMIEPVTGKLEDRISGSDGESVSPSVLTFAFKGVQNIRKSQVAQIDHGRWEIRLVPAPAFGADDRTKLVDNIHKLVDPRIDVQVVLKDEIPCTAAGKFRWVVNEWRRPRMPSLPTANTE